jgi:hypothetical protein
VYRKQSSSPKKARANQAYSRHPSTMVPELKLAAALADDSEKASITSPMNFKNEQEMIVHNVDTSPSLEKNDSPYKRLSMSKKKSKYEDAM